MIFKIFAIGFLVSSSVMANPSVGDKVIFDVTRNREGVISKFESSAELLSYDSTKDSFVLRRIGRNFDGTVMVDEETISSRNLVNNVTIDQIFKECPQVDKLAVPAGIFESCWASDGGRMDMWFARVPFGIAKYSVSTDYSETGVLKSFIGEL